METPENQERAREAGTDTNMESESIACAPSDGRWKFPCFSEPAAIVTFLAGPDDKIEKFLVHKDVVCFYSSVLKAAFNGSFIEGQTQTYRFSDVAPSTIGLLVQWLYFQRLQLDQLEPSNRRPFPKQSQEDLNLAELWVLADKFIMPSLQTLIVTSMIRISTRYGKAPSGTFVYVYENTTAGSPLRDLVVHQCVKMTHQALIRRMPDLSPKEMLADMAYYLIGEEEYADHELDEAKLFFVPDSSGVKAL